MIETAQDSGQPQKANHPEIQVFEKKQRNTNTRQGKESCLLATSIQVYPSAGKRETLGIEKEGCDRQPQGTHGLMSEGWCHNSSEVMAVLGWCQAACFLARVDQGFIPCTLRKFMPIFSSWYVSSDNPFSNETDNPSFRMKINGIYSWIRHTVQFLAS